MASRDEIKGDLLGAIPRLRAFAMSLCGKSDEADDLVQETLLKAWRHHSSFAIGTCMSAWLFTILRNAFYSQCRRRRREVEDADGSFADRLTTVPCQSAHMDLQDMRVTVDALPPLQREALILTACHGMPHDEVARRQGCAVGTIKSRVNRARARLAERLGVATAADFGSDWHILASLGSMGRG